MYIDIHTHNNCSSAEIFAIKNIRFGFDKLPNSNNANYSIGLHPWDIDTYKGKNLLAELTNAVQNCNTIAIGEIGLDKNCKTDLKTQQQIFDIQLKVANNLQLPAILHCVKSYAETITILQQNCIKTACIVHGFNKNLQIATLLLKAGCYLSFGKSLLTNTKLQNVFTKIPLSQLFLETDETDISIKTIYQKATELRNITLETLQNQISDNYNRCFK